MSSDDITDRFPSDEPQKTAPILEQLVAEVRALREETRELRDESRALREETRALREETRGTREAVATLGVDLRKEIADFKAEMVEALDDLDRSIAGLQADTVRRYSRVEERVQTLEQDRQQTP